MPLTLRIGGLFLLLATLFAAAVFAVPTVFLHFSKLLPENYLYTVDAALKAGKPEVAERLARERIASRYYDFEAHYLLAQSHAATGNFPEAANVIRQVLRKATAAKGRKVGATGFDEARTYRLLAHYLMQSGEVLAGSEMLRAALDGGEIREQSESQSEPQTSVSLELLAAKATLAVHQADSDSYKKLAEQIAATPDGRVETTLHALSADWTELNDGNTSKAVSELTNALQMNPGSELLKLRLSNSLLRSDNILSATAYEQSATETTGVRTLRLDTFELPAGAVITSRSITLTRTSGTTVTASTGVYTAHSLLLNLGGSKALGMAPIVVIKEGGKELSRLYLDGLKPKLYDLRLWPKGAPKSLTLTLEFENDGFDLVSKDDRNVEIFFAALH